VNHYAFAPELAQETPYTVALIELEGGGRVYGRLERSESQQLNISADMPVTLDAQATGQRGYPVYRPAAHAEVTKSD
jgi:uncharacterized OB-fold protein